jgi:hypothetical protein
MRNSTLYFPHIEIANPTWLKASLLLWDKVYRIVPRSYAPDDCDDTKKAVEADLVRSISLEPDDLSGITRQFTSFVRSLSFVPAGLDSDDGALIHPEKIDTTLYPLLEQYARGERRGGWIELPREMVRGYMFFLSAQVAERRQLERSTDDASSFAVSGFFSEGANFGEFLYDRVAPGFYSSLVFSDLLPSSVEHLRIEDVIRIARDSHDERIEFREQLMKFTSGLSRCESRDHAETVLNDYKRELIDARDRLKAAQGFLGKHEVGSLLAVGVPVAMTAYGVIASAGDPFDFHTLASAILIGAIAAYADFKRTVAAADNPYGAAYLVSLDREFAGTGKYPAFDRYLEEFVND